MFKKSKQSKKRNPLADFFLKTTPNKQRQVLNKVAESVNQQQRKILQESSRAGN